MVPSRYRGAHRRHGLTGTSHGTGHSTDRLALAAYAQYATEHQLHQSAQRDRTHHQTAPLAPCRLRHTPRPISLTETGGNPTVAVARPQPQQQQQPLVSGAQDAVHSLTTNSPLKRLEQLAPRIASIESIGAIGAIEPSVREKHDGQQRVTRRVRIPGAHKKPSQREHPHNFT